MVFKRTDLFFQVESDLHEQHKVISFHQMLRGSLTADELGSLFLVGNLLVLSFTKILEFSNSLFLPSSHIVMMHIDAFFRP